MADSLDEAQRRYRAADEELIAARDAFEKAPWRDREQRTKTWKRLEAAENAYRDAMTDYAPWITGDKR